MTERVSKTSKVAEYLKNRPKASAKETMQKFKCSGPTFYKARLLANGNGSPATRKHKPKEDKLNDLINDLATIRKIGVDRVKRILEILE